jgi:hypothetical protein
MLCFGALPAEQNLSANCPENANFIGAAGPILIRILSHQVFTCFSLETGAALQVSSLRRRDLEHDVDETWNMRCASNQNVNRPPTWMMRWVPAAEVILP